MNDSKLVEDAKGLVRSHIISPSLREVKGTWYIFEQEGRVPKILLDDGSGYFIDEPYTRDRIEELGWRVTPLVIYKIVAVR